MKLAFYHTYTCWLVTPVYTQCVYFYYRWSWLFETNIL